MQDYKEGPSIQQKKEDARKRILRDLCKVYVNATDLLIIPYMKRIFLAFGPIQIIKWQPNRMSVLKEQEITIIYEFPESAKLAQLYLNKTEHFEHKIMVAGHEFSKNKTEILINMISKKRIFLVGFYTDVEEDEIKNIFETDHGKIHKCYWAPNIGEIAGYAFIEFKDNNAAESALNTIKEFSYNGFHIKVGPVYSPSHKVYNGLWLNAEEATQYALTFGEDIVKGEEQAEEQAEKQAEEQEDVAGKIIRKFSKIYVENIKSNLKENVIKDTFLQFGPIKDFKRSETSDEYTFIEYEFPEAANLAMLKMDGKLLQDRRLNIHFSNIVEGPLIKLLFIRLRCRIYDTVYIAGVKTLSEKQLIVFLKQKEIKYKKIFYIEKSDNFAFIQLKNASAVSKVIIKCNNCKYRNATLISGQAFFPPGGAENETLQWNRSNVIKTLKRELDRVSTFNTDELQMGEVIYPGYEKLYEKYVEKIYQSLQACSQGAANTQYCVSNLCFPPEDFQNFNDLNTILIPQHLINEICETYLKTLLKENRSDIESNKLSVYSNILPLPDEGKYLQLVHNYSYIQNQQLTPGMTFLVTSLIQNPTVTTRSHIDMFSTSPTNVPAGGDEEKKNAPVLQPAQPSTSALARLDVTATGNVQLPTKEEKKKARKQAKRGLNLPLPLKTSAQTTTAENIMIRYRPRKTPNYDIVSNILTHLPSTEVEEKLTSKNLTQRITSEAQNLSPSSPKRGKKFSWKPAPTNFFFSEDCFTSPGGTRRQTPTPNQNKSNPKRPSKK